MRVAILGLGKQAPKHLRGLLGAGLSRSAIVLADADPSRADALALQEGIEAIPVDRIFEDASIQALVIATPLPTHQQLVNRAIDAGKAFLCEKPLAACAREADELEQRARERSVVGMVGTIYRSVPVFQKVQSLFDRRSLPGTPTLALFRIGGRGSHEGWKHRKASGGGAINEMLVHMLDLALSLFGPPLGVKLLASELRTAHRRIRGTLEVADAEDFILACLSYPDGPSVYIEADMLTPAFTQRVEIQGTEFTIVASIEEQEPSYLYLSEPSGPFDRGRNTLSVPKEDPYSIQARTFLEAVEAGTEPRYGTLREAVLLHRILDQLHTAQRTPA